MRGDLHRDGVTVGLEIEGLNGGSDGGDRVLQEENGWAECEEEIEREREREEGGKGVREEEEEDSNELEGSEAMDGGVAFNEWVGFGK